MISDLQWDALTALIDEGWPGKFDDHAAAAWRVLLESIGADAEEISRGIAACVARGGRYRPSAPELVAELRRLRDPDKPTFEEAYQLIYGRRGILRAPTPRGPYADMGEMRRAEHEAMRARATECHPLVASFVDRYGLDRLRMLEVDDPEYGALRRNELHEAWDRHREAMEGRDVATLVQGRRGELGRFDPLRALGGPRQIERAAS